MLPTVIQRVAFDELEWALDLRAKLLGRQQLAAVGDDDYRNRNESHESAVAAIENPQGPNWK